MKLAESLRLPRKRRRRVPGQALYYKQKIFHYLKSRLGQKTLGAALMQLEFHQLELPYQALRIVNRKLQAKLMSSLCTHGQQDPVWVVKKADEEGRFVLIDGYMRVTCLKRLRHDVVLAVDMPLEEQDALCLSYNHDKDKKRNTFEEGWLIQELCGRHGLAQAQIAMRLGKSESWVSRRLALVKELPFDVQEKVRRGNVCPHGAMRYLVPLARAKPKACEQLMAAVGQATLSSRQLKILVCSFRAANNEEREKILARPLLYLKAEQGRDLGSQNELSSDEEKIRKDLDRLGDIARCLREHLDHNVSLAHYLPSIIEGSWQHAFGCIEQLRHLLEEQYHVGLRDSIGDFDAKEKGIWVASHRP